MDVSFEPQAVKLTITLTPTEAKSIILDLPPIVYDIDRPLSKLAKAIGHISKMNSDELLREMNMEMTQSNSGPGGLGPGR